jgi:hypothetical protein
LGDDPKRPSENRAADNPDAVLKRTRRRLLHGAIIVVAAAIGLIVVLALAG